MEKEVIISIKGKQEVGDGPAESMELVTKGWMQRKDGVYTLTYQESEMTGLEGTLTTIKVEQEEERVTLTRVGEYNSEMVFEEGNRHLSLYNTPYGAVSMGVNTRHLLAELDDNGGCVEVDYTLEVEGAVVGRNTFQIRAKDAPAGSGLKI